VEDRRGRGGGGFGIPLGKGGIGCGGLILVLIVSWLTGINPLALIGMAEQGGGPQADVRPVDTGGPTEPRADADEARLAGLVLADTEETWNNLFAQRGQTYRPPVLVLFDRATSSACGYGSAAVGPFYCPADQKVYIDLSFFRQLDQQFGAPGDFAQAYVIAHEVGHHVQNLLGISSEIQNRRQRASQREGNQLSVALELQADCLAGVWGNRAETQRDRLEEGDIEEGLRAAEAIGDDVLQRRSQGQVQPESWTHGSSEQRAHWFRRGFDTGDPDACDTFAAM
jgi:predicted metalloprotease